MATVLAHNLLVPTDVLDHVSHAAGVGLEPTAVLCLFHTDQRRVLIVKDRHMVNVEAKVLPQKKIPENCWGDLAQGAYGIIAELGILSSAVGPMHFIGSTSRMYQNPRTRRGRVGKMYYAFFCTLTDPSVNLSLASREHFVWVGWATPSELQQMIAPASIQKKVLTTNILDAAFAFRANN